MAIHVWIQLLQQITRMLRPVSAQMFFLQEEVHAQIGFADDCGILYGEVANPREDEIFEGLDADHTRSGVDEENVRVFERDLSGGSPETKLSVVPAMLS
jgi:hypothetical protein